MKKFRMIILTLVIVFCLSFYISIPVLGCKDIIACGDSTAGDFNLLLKVRDPSRPGLQVLTIVPKDYEYYFYYPWTGRKFIVNVENKYIGVASQTDVIPNIVKSGMVVTDKGLAFGDADTNSLWINPTRFAWDDFDWIRYSCERADNIDEAVSLLTEDAVNKYHATGVSENLFVVGPNSGYIIEADAFRYKIKKLTNDVGVMSNYPKELWGSQIQRTLPISKTFDFTINDTFSIGDVVRLNSLYGIKIVDITESSIFARQVPIFKINFHTFLFVGEKTEIKINERKNVGDFSLKVIDITDNSVEIELKYKFNAWEDKMLEYINSRYGEIDVKDMIGWSRLKSSDIDGLRGMCEGNYDNEAVAVYKIPNDDYDVFSMGWFSPSFSCSSIFVPFHICDNEIFEPYENGNAAQLGQNLFKIYGYDNLSFFEEIEDVFLFENEAVENLVKKIIKNKSMASDILTIFDKNVQKQAYLTERILLKIDNIIDLEEKEKCFNLIEEMWRSNYSNSLSNIKNTVLKIMNINNSYEIINDLNNISFSIINSNLEIANILGLESNLLW